MITIFPNSKRCSRDDLVNVFGRYVLQVCKQFNPCSLNGGVNGDKLRDFTDISVIDMINCFIGNPEPLTISKSKQQIKLKTCH